jgi:hypothetical protein
MLSSVLDFWPGYVGYQTFVWMGVCDDVAVWTQSGIVEEKWLDRSGDIANSHLPSVVQESNVVLIVYQPYAPMRTDNRDVALYWPAQRFDEVATIDHVLNSDDTIGSLFNGGIWDWLSWIWRLIFGEPKKSLGSWILGSRGDSFIAVLRPCSDQTKMGWNTCGGDNGRQFWAAVVGDATRHKSFANFTDLVQKAVVQDTSPSSWFRLFPRGGSLLNTVSITVDGTTITHVW